MKFQATLYALAGVVATTLAAGVIEQDIQTMILHTTTFDHDVIQFSRGPLPRLALVPVSLKDIVKLANISFTVPPRRCICSRLFYRPRHNGSKCKL